MGFKAILFDCDGVLLETERSMRQLFLDLLADKVSMTLDEAVDVWRGFSTPKVAEWLLETGVNVPSDYGDFLLQNAREQYVNISTIIPSVDILLASIKLPMAVCSSGATISFKPALIKHKIAHYFTHFVGRDSVNGVAKPAPDIYLEAIKRFGFSSEECLAIEDSVTGVKSATHAGCFVVGFTASGSDAQSLIGAGAHWVVSSHEELIEKLPTILSE